MVNHVRTLLLGVSGSNSPGSNFPGEEPVPADFRPSTLAAELKNVRACLFGSRPDRLYLNYRLRQFMTLLHATELDEHVRKFDSRITYKPGEAEDLFAGRFGVSVEGSELPIYFSGQFAVDEALGRAQGQWRVSTGFHASTNIVGPIRLIQDCTVIQESDPVTVSSHEIVATNTLTDSIELGRGLRCRATWSFFTADTVWHITARSRPSRGLPEIVSALRQSPLTAEPGELFGNPLVEPYTTYWNLWSKHDFLPYHLGGLLMAYASRVDDLMHRNS